MEQLAKVTKVEGEVLISVCSFLFPSSGVFVPSPTQVSVVLCVAVPCLAFLPLSHCSSPAERLLMSTGSHSELTGQSVCEKLQGVTVTYQC